MSEKKDDLKEQEKKSEKYLGRKREQPSGKIEEIIPDKTKEKIKKKEDSENSGSDSDSESSKPRKSLFSKDEKGFTGGLFGNLDNTSQKKSLFENFTAEAPKQSLFGNTGGSLFSEKSDEKKEGGLFGPGLFDFSNINKKKEEEEEEGDDNIGKSNSPKREYNPEEQEEIEDKDGYIKRYAKKVDNTALYNKEEKKFISRGDGFIIIETLENKDEKKRYARILYRNTIGGIIFQGVLNDKINKCHPYENKLKHICHIFFLMENETKDNKDNKDKDDKEKLVLGQAKIRFMTKDEIDKFCEKYNNAIKYIKNDIDNF